MHSANRAGTFCLALLPRDMSVLRLPRNQKRRVIASNFIPGGLGIISRELDRRFHPPPPSPFHRRSADLSRKVEERIRHLANHRFVNLFKQFLQAAN